MSSEQATISESVEKNTCDECNAHIVPSVAPATNRDYCPQCGYVFEKREQKYGGMDE